METLIREYQEEIKAAILIEAYLGCIENIFKIDDQLGHKLIQAHSAKFKDSVLLEYDSFEV